MISVILIEPSFPGNIGSICRAMANFEFNELIIVNPKCDVFASDAIKMSKWGSDILKKAKIVDFDYLKKFDYLIGTTGKVGTTDYNIIRSPITPDELADLINKKENSKIAILFGREDKGLTNEELELCDFVVSIPASKKYPILNLAQAATIIFYELFKNNNSKLSNLSHIKYATAKEKEILMSILKNKLDKMHFATKEKKETQIKVWKRMIGKSFLTKREAMALMGFLKRI